jgi:hypothetical protein
LRDLDLTALALLARLFRTVQLTDRGKATIDALLELLRSLLDGLEPSQ